MHRFMVNFKPASIFNRFFEMQKSTRNGKNNAKIRALGTWRFGVYHGQINHDRALRDTNDALTRVSAALDSLGVVNRLSNARLRAARTLNY
jgi:hypothetical protein